jgi:hypothetical protein
MQIWLRNLGTKTVDIELYTPNMKASKLAFDHIMPGWLVFREHPFWLRNLKFAIRTPLQFSGRWENPTAANCGV